MDLLDPKRTCPHSLQPDVQIQVFNDSAAKTVSIGYMLSLAISCTICGERFTWPGLQTGQSFTAPRVTPDGFRLLAPMRPESFTEMAVEKLPDIVPDAKLEDRVASAVRRALMAPEAYAIAPAERGPQRVEFRVRAITNAVMVEVEQK